MPDCVSIRVESRSDQKRPAYAFDGFTTVTLGELLPTVMFVDLVYQNQTLVLDVNAYDHQWVVPLVRPTGSP